MNEPPTIHDLYDPAQDFTKPPYDRMLDILAEDHSGDLWPIPPYPDDPNDPCYGCGNWYGPCIWPCWRQMGYDKYIQ